LSANGFNVLILSQKLMVVVPLDPLISYKRKLRNLKMNFRKIPPQNIIYVIVVTLVKQKMVLNIQKKIHLIKWKKTIVKCIFESLDIVQETRASLNTF